MGCGTNQGVRGVVLVSLLLSLAFFFVSPLSLKHRIIESNAADIARKQTHSKAIHSSSSSPSSSSWSLVTIHNASSTVTSSIHVGGSRVDPNRGSMRRVPNGPDLIHNRRVGRSRQPAGRV